MATKVDIEGTSISASQMSEFFRLASLSGHVNGKTFQAYLEKRNPYEETKSVKTDKVFVIDIPTGSTITQMVKKGKYDWVNEHVKRFDSDEKLAGRWECELVAPRFPISSDKGIELCSKDGWQLATIDHLLIFGVTHPDVQSKNWVVCLGSSIAVEGYRSAPVLCGQTSFQSLVMVSWDCGWYPSQRLLRVRRLGA